MLVAAPQVHLIKTGQQMEQASSRKYLRPVRIARVSLYVWSGNVFAYNVSTNVSPNSKKLIYRDVEVCPMWNSSSLWDIGWVSDWIVGHWQRKTLGEEERLTVQRRHFHKQLSTASIWMKSLAGTTRSRLSKVLRIDLTALTRSTRHVEAKRLNVN